MVLAERNQDAHVREIATRRDHSERPQDLASYDQAPSCDHELGQYDLFKLRRWPLDSPRRTIGPACLK